MCMSMTPIPDLGPRPLQPLLRPRSVAYKTVIARELREQVWPLIEAGTVKVVMDSTYPLAEASKAHARMETNAHIGKIVLTA